MSTAMILFEGESERVVFLLKRIQEEEVPMSFETYIKLQTWHREDAWSDGELQEYFLHQRKGKEVKIMFDFDNASSEEIEILEYLNRFLEGKGRKFQVLNIHNARYVDVSELIPEIKIRVVVKTTLMLFLFYIFSTKSQMISTHLSIPISPLFREIV